MRSSIEELRNRGFAEQQDIALLAGKSQEDLFLLLQDMNPVIRTSAATNLLIANKSELMVSKQLLKLLAVEKCLYTKLAVCEALEKGGVITAGEMIAYLGKIGNNQYRRLPDKVSLKKSYPLPRDIIARTLGRMSVSVFPVLIQVLQSDDAEKISEVLDAIGYMIFYNRQLSTEENARLIFEVLEKYQENDLLQWKAILCLSGFAIEESIVKLKFYCEKSEKNNLLSAEATRALALINIAI